ncbi:unnamed protein product [Musa acuminata subsp. malaccensis]|uniref:(wild Malaysian banana) hypothetical protein n=1 Tax=Musa acuminata subsp. malaccensis TaxID=214687 RepID=A0A804KE80_MUSAM|nr:unnamed protein product [Musa acuminata subsp. malaccensis]CAG1833642.1 unnamed protein product [Musa acuminata subsp. malaccensis]
MTELQSPTDARVFCLTKIIEIVNYNMISHSIGLVSHLECPC